MSRENTAYMLSKFGETKWMQELKKGKISFSCPGKYIQIAEETGNSEQGDLYEGIFARLKKGDLRIKECRIKLGDDLEEIYVNDFVFLRRKSTYLIPTFCFYAVKEVDLVENVDKAGWQKVRYDFDERMYSGFFNSGLALDNFSTLAIQPRPFFEYIEKKEQFDFRIIKRPINYTEFKKEEFFIEPTDERDELFYKFPKYSYQKEARIILPDIKMLNLEDRYNLDIEPLPKEDIKIIKGIEVYIEFNLNIEELS